MNPYWRVIPIFVQLLLSRSTVTALQDSAKNGYSLELDCFSPSVYQEGTGGCRIADVENINDNISAYLSELLSTSFFRYYKVLHNLMVMPMTLQINLNRPCPFWKEDLVCTSEGCSIDTLPKDPSGWESKLSDIHFPTFQLAGSVFRAWEKDNDDFCLLDGEGELGVYVDLIENPERFTGYSGSSANKIWQSIYQENCFSQDGKEINSFGKSQWLQCYERQLFYRIISGLHASISVHLADQYFNQRTSQWESNFEIFHERVGKHAERVQNMYMVYMLLLRAIYHLNLKIQGMTFNPNDSLENIHIKQLIQGMIDSLPTRPPSFDPSLFSAETSPIIIDEFKDHFRNVTKIMDCVSCERCRLWGKIQTTGVGTALKVLSLVGDDKWESSIFRRSEIIALFNTLGRLSESIRAMQKFRLTYAKLHANPLWNIHKNWDTLLCVLASMLSGIVAILLFLRVRSSPT